MSNLDTQELYSFGSEAHFSVADDLKDLRIGVLSDAQQGQGDHDGDLEGLENHVIVLSDFANLIFSVGARA